jgi:hypothetical protein
LTGSPNSKQSKFDAEIFCGTEENERSTLLVDAIISFDVDA